MYKLIIKRVIESFILLFFLSLFIFFVIYLAPGNIVDAMFYRPEAISKSLKFTILQNYGLNDNPFLQYFRWIKSAIYGDFGVSFISGENVLDIIKERLQNTIWLCFISFFLIVLFSLILGYLSAIYKNKFLDIFINFSSFTLACLPHFLVGLVLISIFSLQLEILPSSGSNKIGNFGLDLKYLILPTLSIVLPHLGTNIKFVRDTLIENFNLDFIQMAIARGLSEKKVKLLAIRNALPCIISYFGTLVGGIFAGSYVIEAIFSFSGIGDLAINSIIAKDYPVILAVILLTAIFVIFANLIAQILAILLDKRNL